MLDFFTFLTICKEQGISDAIEQGYLKKFEFTIHSKDEDKICHSNMLESYAMSFTYGPEPQIEFSSTNGIPETLDVAKAMVYELVENFSKAYRARMATAEPLPRRFIERSVPGVGRRLD